MIIGKIAYAASPSQEDNRVFDTQSALNTYLSSPNAKAGQGVKLLDSTSGRYKAYIIQGTAGNFTTTAMSGSFVYASALPSVANADADTDYYIGETEVTQALWLAVMGSNPSQHQGDLNYPVERVSWNECQIFISRLNEMTGLNFRMPTEAEWEYAARGGKNSHSYMYAGSDLVDEVAWYSTNSGNLTHLVATKRANELGLYDMSGNVSEWCYDCLGAYTSEAQTNPTGPTGIPYRVQRGGDYNNVARFCRVSSRGYIYPPSYTAEFIGLRLAL